MRIIKASYNKTSRELSLEVDDKQMTFDLLDLPFRGIFSLGTEIWDIDIDRYGHLWVGQDGVMQEYEIKIEK